MASLYDENPTLSPETNALRALVRAIQDSMGNLRVPGANNYAYRRYTECFQCAVKATPFATKLPDGFFGPGGPGEGTTSFSVVNLNPFPVQIKGSQGSTGLLPSDTSGWIPYPPFFFGTFTTQYPDFIATRVIQYPWFTYPDPTTYAPLWFNWGGGL